MICVRICVVGCTTTGIEDVFSYRRTTSREIVLQFCAAGGGQVNHQIDLVVGDHIADIAGIPSNKEVGQGYG